jgi:glycosyltransferase 2 family protein
VALSVALLMLVGMKVDFGEVAGHLGDVPMWIFLWVAIGYVCTQFISAMRWHLLLSCAGIKCSRQKAVEATFIGMAINSVGLGTVGGDLGKALLVSSKGLLGLSVATVAADRLLGMGVLASIGVISSVFAALPAGHLLYEAVALVVVFGGAAVWLLLPETLQYLTRFERLRRHVAPLSAAFPRDRKVLSKMIAVALLYHAMQIGIVGVMMHGMGLHVDVLYLFSAVPFINIASTLPLSWMGLGVRESLYITFFAPSCMTAVQAVTISALWFISLTAGALAGGVVALLTGASRQLRRGEEEAAAAQDS